MKTEEFMHKFLIALSVLVVVACSANKTEIVPSIVPNSAKEQKVIKVMPENVIGAVERIYFPPMKVPFISRIDTGATTSSLDAENIKRFERDGQSWVSFTIVNRESNERYTFEKPIVKRVKIKRIGDDEKRITVEMDVKMGGKAFKADFTVAARTDFNYQTLIGRNILNGRFIVDVAQEHTLK